MATLSISSDSSLGKVATASDANSSNRSLEISNTIRAYRDGPFYQSGVWSSRTTTTWVSEGDATPRATTIAGAPQLRPGSIVLSQRYPVAGIREIERVPVVTLRH